MNNLNLLENTRKLVKLEKKTTYQILKHLEEVEKRKAFCELGYSSLFKYCVKELKYSEREAYTRINSMRLMRTDKRIETKIKNEELNLTKAALLERERKQHNLSQQETLDLMEKIKGLSSRETQKELKPITEKIITLRLNVSTSRKLEKVKKMLGREYKDEEIIEILLDQKLREHQKVREGAKHSRYISKHLRSAVFKRANHTCEHPKCTEMRNLHIDHIIPYAKGGLNELSNLRVLCSAHNQFERIKCFG